MNGVSALSHLRPREPCPLSIVTWGHREKTASRKQEAGPLQALSLLAPCWSHLPASRTGRTPELVVHNGRCLVVLLQQPEQTKGVLEASEPGLGVSGGSCTVTRWGLPSSLSHCGASWAQRWVCPVSGLAAAWPEAGASAAPSVE